MTKTETPDTQLAVLAVDIAYIKKSQDRIEQSVKELSNVYATKQDLKEVADKVTVLGDRSNFWRIVSPTASAIVSAIIVFLLVSYLQTK